MFYLWLPLSLEKRLDRLAKKTGRTKNSCASEAILRHIGDLEDYYLAQRLMHRTRKRIPINLLKK